MNLPDIFKLLADLPPDAVKDAAALVEEGVTFAAHVKAFLEKYPQLIEDIKKLT